MSKQAAVNAGKNSLPFIAASVICGYANDSIPHFFAEGDLRDWAYRSIPFLSICILFIFRVIKDVGGMSISQIIHNGICAPLEKRKLKSILEDNHASQSKKDRAQERYDEIIQSEIDVSSRLLNYVMPWVKVKPVTPELPAVETRRD